MLSGSLEKKEVGKRSSPYPNEEPPLETKRRKTRRKKHRGRHVTDNRWDEKLKKEGKQDDESKKNKSRQGRKNRRKSHKHKVKNKNRKQSSKMFGKAVTKNATLPEPFKYALDGDTVQKIRHSAYERKYTHVPSYGRYSDMDSVIEKSGSYAYARPQSAPIATEIFNNNQNKNFERWKVKYEGRLQDKYPEWPKFRNSVKPFVYDIQTQPHEEGLIVHNHQDKEDSFKNKLSEIRRWGMLKQDRKTGEDWSLTNEVGSEAGWKQNSSSTTTKAQNLASNQWPARKEEKNWPQFTYHRVTSSPSIQTRGAQLQQPQRRRSAYVAVSAVPTNITGRTTPEQQEPITRPHLPVLPDLFDKIVEAASSDKLSALKGVEERFSYRNEDRARLQQVMRDGEFRFNRTAAAAARETDIELE